MNLRKVSGPVASLINLCLLAVAVAAVGLLVAARVAAETAELRSAAKVYADYESSIFQLRLIESGSDSQSSLGSGFLVADHLIVTNFHVVSSSVFKPDKYRVELDWLGTVVPLQIHAIDVVNDLALLRFENMPTEGGSLPFLLRQDLPRKGDVLYSLGNPHDLGMTVVEGNFNGIVEHRYSQQIHFSGAVNPGMSGGPVVDEQARVVGVNVATAGNQIGFLVPVAAVQRLLDSALEARTRDKLLIVAGQQIGNYTDAMIASLLASPWEQKSMGDARILSASAPWLDCWGESEKAETSHSYTVSLGCHSGSSVYLSRGFNSGFIEYEFFYFAAPSWPDMSVYQYLANETSRAMPANSGTKEQLGQFSCNHSQVENRSGLSARVSFCTRPYKKLPELHDVFFMAVSVDRDKQAVMSHYTLSGVTEASSQKFLEHFIEVISWAP